MKKYILALFLVLFIVPSIASASWRNHFFPWKTWKTKTFSFRHKEMGTEKLEKELNDFKNKQSNSSPITTTSEGKKIKKVTQ
jgi:hypothetical protein